MEIESAARLAGPHTAPGVELAFDPESNVTTITLPPQVATPPKSQEPMFVRLGGTDTVLSSTSPTTPMVIRAHVDPERKRRSVIIEQPPSPMRPSIASATVATFEEAIASNSAPRAIPAQLSLLDATVNEPSRSPEDKAIAPRSPTITRIPIPEKRDPSGPSVITVRAHVHAAPRPQERVIIEVPPTEPRAPTIVHLSAPEEDNPNSSHRVEMPSTVRIPAVIERPQVLRVRQASS